MKTALIIVLTMGNVLSWRAFAATNDLSSALQRGLFEEEANHNLAAAIQAYQSVITRFDESRTLAATAIFRLGECYRKQGKTNEAIAQYNRVLSEFGDQPELTSLSRGYLAAAGQPGTTGQPKSFNEMKEADARRTATAAEGEEVRRIQAMIRDSPDLINSKGASGLTPLESAAAEGQLIVAEFLLTNGADVQSSRDGGVTPLYEAALNGHKAMVELLLKYKANVKAADREGKTALHAAAEKGFRTVVEVLIAHGADVNAKSSSGSTPLHFAAVNGFKTVAETLLAHSGDPNAATEHLNPGGGPSGTALHLSAWQNNAGMAQLLLDHNANVAAVDRQGETPLHRTAVSGAPDVAKLLLAHGANVNAPDQTQRTPLHLAVTKGSIEIASLLLSHGAEVNARDQQENGRGWTPLHEAVTQPQSRTQMVSLLLGGKADPNSRFDVNLSPGLLPKGPANITRGYTPLLFAISRGNVELAELLLDGKADPNLKSESGTIPIFAALAGQDPARRQRLVSLLLDHGADVEARNENRATPLIKAVALDDPHTVQILLDHKANMNAQASNGDSPLHLLLRMAASQTTVEIAKMLLNAGADPNLRAGTGKTPLGHVEATLANPGQANPALQEFAKVLREHGAVEDLPRLDVVQIQRPSTGWPVGVLEKGTNDWNHFTLLELFAIGYNFLTSKPDWGESRSYESILNWAQGRLPFPDLKAVRIRHPSPDLKSWQERTVDLRTLFDAADCSQDQPLQWGDVVEVPEADHPVNTSWSGFSHEELWAIRTCLSRDVQIVVKGRATKITLAPEIKFAAPPSAHGVSVPINTDATFWIKPVLRKSNLVLTSSDLTRVKVIRRDPATGKNHEWVLDCSDGKPAPDLWLRAGDVIEVPDKM